MGANFSEIAAQQVGDCADQVPSANRVAQRYRSLEKTGDGREVLFRYKIIGITSNLGMKEVEKAGEPALGFGPDREGKDLTKEQVLEIVVRELSHLFSPEFLGRIGDQNIILFSKLKKDVRENIIEERLQTYIIPTLKMRFRFEDITYSPQVISHLEEAGYDKYGARDLKRKLAMAIVDPINKGILEGTLNFGDKILIDVDDAGKFTFTRQNA